MHRPHPPAPLLTALERLAAAASLTDVLNAAGDWVDLGLLDGIALWLRDPDHGVLRLAHARGLPDSLQSWRPGAREAGGPVWRVFERAEPALVDLADLPLGLAVPLRDSAVTHFCLYPLRDPHGEPLGVALSGLDLRRDPGRSDQALPWATLGAAIHRARASDAHHWRAQWFDALLPLLDNGVIVAGPDGEIHRYSQSLQDLVGWTEAQVRKHGWIGLVYPDPDDRAAITGAIAALMMGTPSRGVVRALTTAEGNQIDAAIYSALVPHPSGGSPAFIGALRDMTRARRAARERARDDALTRLGRMAGGVAHEFNNLLGAIMGHAELVALSDDATADLRRRAETVVAAAQRGGVLSRQLLAFSGATISRLAPIATVPFLDELIELYRPSMPPGLSLSFDIPAESCSVEADPAHLQQAFINLLVNAGQAAEHAIGVRMDAAHLPSTVRFASAEAPEPGTRMCRIQVWDDGPGFSDDALANLFEPFWTGKPTGHGLGLAAVRGIVGMHGGAIDIDRRPEGGAEVTVYLPFSTRPELELPRLTATHAPARGTVWMIDDEQPLLEFASIALRSQGYSVRTFSRGQQAIDAASQLEPAQHPDVVVVDVVMPDLDGPTTIAALASLGIRPRLLWTSGFSPERTHVPSTGRFLQKPYAGTELGMAIAQLLGEATS